MKNRKAVSENFQGAIQHESLLITAPSSANVKSKPYIKKIIFVVGLAGIGFFLNSCTAGYVATQPSYVEYSRPERPSERHVWIDGDWVYNRQSRAYEQRNGYWERPYQGRTYVSGQWQTTPKGKYWSKGRWQRKAREENRHNRY
jgi:hypothetical protein